MKQGAGFEIKRAVANNAIDFAAWVFPEGKRIGLNWHVGDVSGNPGKSLAISLGGEFAGSFRDWATGEHGDCISLVMGARGIDFASATQLLSSRYGIHHSSRHGAATRPDNNNVLPALPALELGNRQDFALLSRTRNLAHDSLKVAAKRGNLRFYNSTEGRAWLITDSARRNAQARRLDGKAWAWNGKKAWTLKGSSASWPIGLSDSALFSNIALCEGGPDFLAAFHHALASEVLDQLAPVCMTGASVSVPAECLSSFKGKRVRIFVHSDTEGLKAASRWAGQLRGIAKSVDGFTFDGLVRVNGSPVEDLCDLASIDPDSWEINRSVVEDCMGFANQKGGRN